MERVEEGWLGRVRKKIALWVSVGVGEINRLVILVGYLLPVYEGGWSVRTFARFREGPSSKFCSKQRQQQERMCGEGVSRRMI